MKVLTTIFLSLLSVTVFAQVTPTLPDAEPKPLPVPSTELLGDEIPQPEALVGDLTGATTGNTTPSSTPTPALPANSTDTRNTINSSNASQPVSSTPVNSSTTTESQDNLGKIQMNLAEFLEQGGIVMYPLMGLSVIVVILIFFYLLTIRRNAVVSDQFMTTAEALIRKRDYLGLVAFCSRRGQSIARISEKTLHFMTKNSGVSFNEVREVAEAEGSRQAGMLSQRISYLSDIGAVAPMIGLLGTVIGMIQAFGTMSTELNKQATQALAASIQEALITTASGLVIGIVAVLFYSYFRGRVKKYIAELEAAATHLMALLAAQANQRYTHESIEVPAPVPTQEQEYTAPVGDFSEPQHQQQSQSQPQPVRERRRR